MRTPPVKFTLVMLYKGLLVLEEGSSRPAVEALLLHSVAPQGSVTSERGRRSWTTVSRRFPGRFWSLSYAGIRMQGLQATRIVSAPCAWSWRFAGGVPSRVMDGGLVVGHIHAHIPAAIGARRVVCFVLFQMYRSLKL